VPRIWWYGHRGGVLAGYSAALALGSRLRARARAAEVLVRPTHAANPGCSCGRVWVTAAEVTAVDGLPGTSPARTAWDLARAAGGDRGDGGGRRAGARRVVHPRRPAANAAKPSPGPGLPATGRVLELADPRAESPMETVAPPRPVLAGLPRPDVQYPVSDEHGFGPRPVDLAYPRARLAIE